MERVLVVLPNWFGETLFATPFLRALRTAQPRAHITALGWPRCRDVLAHNPHLQELLDYDEDRAHRGVVGAWRLVRLLRRRRFNAAYILRRSLSRTLLVALAGIPARVGFANAKSGWLLTRPVPPPPSPRHKATAYLSLLDDVTRTGPSAPYEYFIGEEERRWALEWLRSQGLLNGRPLIMLHPGANWPHKRWPLDYFARLGDRLAASHPARVMITGGPGDVESARTIQRLMREPSTALAGRTSFRQLAACVEQARLVVANDTGVLHVAAALHRPLVALYGPTSPFLTGPLGDPRRTMVLHHPDCCPRVPCYQPDDPPHPGMQAIPVDEAYGAAMRLLGTRD